MVELTDQQVDGDALKMVHLLLFTFQRLSKNLFNIYLFSHKHHHILNSKISIANLTFSNWPFQLTPELQLTNIDEKKNGLN